MACPTISSDLYDAINKAMEKKVEGVSHRDKARMLKDLSEFYAKHQKTVDLAAQAVQKLSKRSEGEFTRDILDNSFNGDPSGVDPAPFIDALNGPELESVISSADSGGLQAVSVGLTAGISAILAGAAAGVDVLIGKNDLAGKYYARGFYLYGVGLDIYLGIGINIGLWLKKPTIDQKTYAAGFIFDVPFFRVFLVYELKDKNDFSSGTLVAVTIAPSVIAIALFLAFTGEEYVLGIPPPRAQLSVKNCTDGDNPCKPGTASIIQNVPSKLTLTLTNTSGQNINIPNEAVLNVIMPKFFNASQLSKSTISAANWENPTWTAGRLALTYKEGTSNTWGSEDTQVINFGNMIASGGDANNTNGLMRAAILSAEPAKPVIDVAGLIAQTPLQLVLNILNISFSYTITIDNSQFTVTDGSLTGNGSSPTVSKTTQNTVCTLQNTDGSTWRVGYKCYLDTDGQTILFIAFWTKSNVSLTYPSQPDTVTSTSKEVTAYYKTMSNPNYVKFEVQKVSSASN